MIFVTGNEVFFFIFFIFLYCDFGHPVFWTWDESVFNMFQVVKMTVKALDISEICLDKIF